MAGKPTPLFYAAVVAVVLALIGFAIWQAGDILAPGGNQASSSGKTATATDIDLTEITGAEDDSNPSGVTTVKEYSFKSSERLPPVTGTAAYKPMKDNTVRFALNVWAGWAPIIQANNGFRADKVWKTSDGKEFKVELVLIDNPVEMRDAYAAGEVHIGWATLDMMPLFMDCLLYTSPSPRDQRGSRMPSSA